MLVLDCPRSKFYFVNHIKLFNYGDVHELLCILSYIAKCSVIFSVLNSFQMFMIMYEHFITEYSYRVLLFMNTPIVSVVIVVLLCMECIYKLQ